MTTSRILCDTEGCGSAIPVGFDIDEPRADAIARREGWSVQVGTARSYHRCTRCSGSPDRALVQRVLRHAAEITEPRGLHAALRELGAEAVADQAWSAFYAASGESLSERLLDAARRVETDCGKEAP